MDDAPERSHRATRLPGLIHAGLAVPRVGAGGALLHVAVAVKGHDYANDDVNLETATGRQPMGRTERPAVR